MPDTLDPADTPDAALFDPWTRDYAVLGLRLDRLAPGTVDAWIGPAEWREAVLREPLPSADALRAAAESLQGRLPSMAYAPAREGYLSRQVTALQASTRLLAGETLPLQEQAALFFDIRPQRVPEDTFAAAHAELDAALPGTGSLVERYNAWRSALEVPPDRLDSLLHRALVEVRSRTLAHLQLPAREGIEMHLVRNQPWSAYNWYLGHARSRVEVNTDLPLYADGVVDYLAHEAYPGHHTEHAMREYVQYRGQGQAEYAIQLINTPECLISEAIATSASSLIFQEAADLTWLTQNILPDLGMSLDVAQAARVREARHRLSGVNGNAAFLLHEDGRSEDDVVAYLERWALRRPDEARKSLSFLKSPLWRVYTFTYHYGRGLLAPLLAGSDRIEVFRRIISEPVYPTLLAGWPRIA